MGAYDRLPATLKRPSRLVCLAGLASCEVNLGLYCISPAVSSLIRDHGIPEGSRKDSFHRLSREIPFAMDLAAVPDARQLALRVTAVVARAIRAVVLACVFRGEFLGVLNG